MDICFAIDNDSARNVIKYTTLNVKGGGAEKNIDGEPCLTG